jgi:phage shock protein E
MARRPVRQMSGRGAALAVGLALGVMSCTVAGESPPPTSQPTTGARAWVAGGATLLDVRSPSEFADGHLAAARNIPVGELGGRLAELPPPPHDVVVYCRSGNRSARAAATLASAGYRVLDLGPMSRW